MGGFFFDRLTRLYSVIIPALVLTILIGYLASMTLGSESVHPAYRQNWMSVRYLVNLMNLQQIWYLCVVPGVNNPFWSLSYEFWYYVGLATCVFLQGWRRLLWLSLLCVFAGPKIILLAPAWISGVIAHRVLRQDLAVSKRFSTILFGFSSACILLLTFGSFSGHPWRDMRVEYPLYYSSEAFADCLFSTLVASNILSISWLTKSQNLLANVLHSCKSFARFFSNRTFSIYLYHFPLLYIAGSVIPFNKGNAIHVALVAGSVLVVCLVLAEFTERRLDLIKRTSKQVFSWFRRFITRDRHSLESTLKL